MATARNGELIFYINQYRIFILFFIIRNGMMVMMMIMTMIYDMIYLLTAIGLSPGGSKHLHTNNT